MFLQTAVGGVTSFTVTVAVQDDLLPQASVTVSVTVFAPTFEQSKLLLSMANVTLPQVSLLPLSISLAAIVAWPDAFKFTVMFLHLASGAVVSTTSIF